MSDILSDNLNCAGSTQAELVVVCDTPSDRVWDDGKVMTKAAMRVFADEVHKNGLNGREFFFVTCAPPLPEDATTDGRIGKYIDQYRPELMKVLNSLPNKKVVIYLGKNAGRAVEGKSVSITKITGRVREVPDVGCHVFPMLSPAMVLRRPEVAEQFAAEFAQVPALREHGWDAESLTKEKTEGKFTWEKDFSSALAANPKFIGVDTEGDGVENDSLPYILQVSWKKDQAIVVPLDKRYYDRWRGWFTSKGIHMTEADFAKNKEQLKTLLKKSAVCGHNFKYDTKVLRNYGITDINWYVDTMQLAFAADDNMVNKSLADCVKRWYAEMAGYSDHFDSTVDKTDMLNVHPEEMLPYAGGDATAVRELGIRLIKLVKEDARQWDTFMKIQMPALRMFVKMESTGILIDRSELRKLQGYLSQLEKDSYRKLIKQVPDDVKRNHYDKGLKFSRDEFIRDILFTEEGFKLTPIVYTKGTMKLPPNQRVPSVSAKDHLPYFDTIPFVADLIQHVKLQKLRSTYVGQEPAWEVKRVNILKNGTLPKRLREQVEEAGFHFKGNVPYRNARPYRCRRRFLSFEGRRRLITHTITLTEDTRLAIDEHGQYWREDKTEPTGFWQYIQRSDFIFPSYHLHRTVTGRTSSSDPNAQNFPKRGELSKAFRKVFVAPKGWKIVGVDLSQAELRIAAWMANENNMLRIYREGGDIHSNTAAAVMGIELKTFMGWKGDESPLPASMVPRGTKGVTTYHELYDFRRFQAKAVNFGFLYGMGWRKFMAYAKTDYGIDLTEQEAQQMRNTFFRLYPGLEKWHLRMREFVRQHGYVRALHGALRRLPSIWSDDEKTQGEAERQAINSPVQRFASDLGLIGLSDYFSDGYDSENVKPLAFIHDAGYILVRDEHSLKFAAGLKWCMENQPIEEMFGIKAPLPICADVEIGDSMGSLQEVKMDAEMPEWLAA